MKLNYQSNVYIAELEAGGAKLTMPRRLTLDERNDFPTAWTSDSRAVLFWSDRNGPNQVFKQNIDQQAAETTASGLGDAWMPRVSPDGKSILYVSSPKGDQRGAFRTWAIAAPNGRELAIQGMTSASNVWMIENF